MHGTWGYMQNSNMHAYFGWYFIREIVCIKAHTYFIKVHPCDAGNPLLLRLSLLPKVLGHDTTDVGDLQHFLQLWCEGHTRVTHPPEMVVPLLVLLGRLRAGAACVRGWGCGREGGGCAREGRYERGCGCVWERESVHVSVRVWTRYVYVWGCACVCVSVWV